MALSSSRTFSLSSNSSRLKVLDLYSNGLWGDVHELFSELKNVEYLDLSGNSFFSSLSINRNNLSSLANTLQHMNLSHNNLGGGFFSGDSIQMFQNLQVLDLGNNGLMGQLPSFGSSPNLKVLRLANNQLYGSVPDELLLGLVPLRNWILMAMDFQVRCQLL
nr:probable inactive receptor kinase At5g10020 [Ipomoea batatas]